MNFELVCEKQPISIIMMTMMIMMMMGNVLEEMSTKVDEHRSALIEESALSATAT